MASWLRHLLLAMLVIAITWSAAVVYWRNSPGTPTPSDLIIVMLGLPLLLLGGLWYGKRLLAPAAPAAADTPSPAPAAPTPAPQTPTMAILGASLRLPHAESAAELAACLERGNARATLDPELVGDDGYPIMSVRAKAADDADARDQVAAWTLRHAGNAGQLQDEHLRALVLGGAVAQELGALAVDDCIAPGQPAPPLQLALLAPPGWNAEVRRTALLYLRQALADAGWPEAAIDAQIADDASAVLPGGARHAPLTLLVACASHVGEYTVNDWSADLTLFSAAHQQGLIPGEGAAGVLLSNAPDGRHPRVSGASALRESSADSERRPDARLLVSLAKRVVQEAGLAVDSVTLVAADTGHRTARLLELVGLVRDGLPHLDSGSDVRALGASCGSCADAAFIAALALAAEQADTLHGPVLCVTNEDPFRRTVLLVRPA